MGAVDGVVAGALFDGDSEAGAFSEGVVVMVVVVDVELEAVLWPGGRTYV